ncbi:hypothetical protein C4D60_Mb03t00320 [Musa balbisiana]|uniref:Pre-mRNA-splicing factor SYF2 n=1 Tax=Musa balbisiana TaxID=52838 RepID=A0A4V4H5S4_MUSBA|nr:hypothetical protein C4D60_Mb03t00320 [Musa balbisiana]
MESHLGTRRSRAWVLRPKGEGKVEGTERKGMEGAGKAHPDCINASNPYHECAEYCFKRISEAKSHADEVENEDSSKEPEERTVHPDCVNASNPYHECSEYCFKRISEAKDQIERNESDIQEDDITSSFSGANQNDSGDAHHVQNDPESGNPNLTEKQKKLFELRLKMNEARKANQMAMVAEKKKMEAPSEARGISKQKWLEERKKKIGKLLDSNGLDMSKAYMLDTQEMAEANFNQKTLYNAHKKRVKNIECDMEAYNEARKLIQSSIVRLLATKIPEENIDRMVKELQDREAKRKSFSRRRKFHEEKDIDSINDRNEHFNKKIERAFGKYTLEIKNNLERGTALPD